MKKILFAVPAKDGLGPHFIAALHNLVFNSNFLPPDKKEIQVDWSLHSTGSIAISRDALARQALDLESDGVVMCDADMRWTPADFARLVSHNLPIVGATYARKIPQTKWVMTGIPGKEPDERGILEVEKIGTGFIYISTEVFRTMQKDLEAEIAYDFFDDAGKAQVGHNFFVQGVKERKFYGEDYGFCINAARCGYKIHADTKMIIPHTGFADYPLPYDRKTS